MSNITAALVAELRNRTGAGMMDCKKALVESNGDIELAIENMRKSGQAKAAKKAGNIAAEGVILVRISADHKKGILLEVNCQTDFVAKDTGFLAFANRVADDVIVSSASLEDLNAKYEEERTQLIAKIGENITIRRLTVLEGSNIGSYTHGAKIAVLVDLATANDELAKKIAMHIAASRPEFVNPEDVSAEVVANEKRIQLEMMYAANEAETDERKKKSPELLEKMILGKMSKFTGEISLTSQNFVMNPSQTVGDFLKSEGNSVVGFKRNEVGEGVEKVTTDFAAEVAAMTAK